MTQTIRIPDETYDRLKAIAEPFVDTEATVISRLLDYYDQNGYSQPATNAKTNGELVQDPDHPDSLLHTRVLRAQFSDEAVPPKWNELVKVAHIKANEVLGPDRMKKISRANLREGNQSSRGFKYVPEIGLSIQGLDSPRSWETALWFARELKVSVEVGFEWHNKEQAANPGRRGILRWTPVS